VVMIYVKVFWVVTPCSAVVGYRRFRGPCCLHLHGEVAGVESESESSFATDLAGQLSLRLGFEPPLGLMTRCLLLVDVYRFVFSFWSVLSAEITVFSLLYVYIFLIIIIIF
jgi:hypothetical protein